MRQQLARSPADAVLPTAVALFGTIELVALEVPAASAAIAIEWLACGLLVFRRTWTLWSCTLSGVLLAVMSHVGPALDEPATPILIWAVASFSLARYLPDLRGLVSLAAIWIALLPAYWVSAELDLADTGFVVVMLAPPYAFGWALRQLDERNALLAEQAQLLVEQQERIRRDAVMAERARIARELHDVVAHSVSAMVVQASVAEDFVTVDPARAVMALREVGGVGREALLETGRLLRIIRDTDDELGRPDRPWIARGSASRCRRLWIPDRPGGTDERVEVRRRSPHNVADHPQSRRPDDHLCQLRRPPDRDSGLGLIGMRERVSIFGGRLTCGFTGDGHFELAATLPLDAP